MRSNLDVIVIEAKKCLSSIKTIGQALECSGSLDPGAWCAFCRLAADFTIFTEKLLEPDPLHSLRLTKFSPRRPKGK